MTYSITVRPSDALEGTVAECTCGRLVVRRTDYEAQRWAAYHGAHHATNRPPRDNDSTVSSRSDATNSGAGDNDSTV
jgi:hypothetical protein